MEPKAFRVLLYLLRNPHRLVTKDELLDAVWQETSVSENSLTRAVALLGGCWETTRGSLATSPQCQLSATALLPMSRCPGEETPNPSLAGNTASSEWSSRERTPGRRQSIVLALAAGGLVAIAICAVIFVRRLHPSASPGHGQSSAVALGMRSVSLVSVSGELRDPVLSPDAKAIAYVWGAENPGAETCMWS